MINGRFRDRFAFWLRRLARTPVGRWLMTLPPVRWGASIFVRVFFSGILRPPPPPTVGSPGVVVSRLDAPLQGIVQDVVHVLGYTAAMVAIYEHGDALSVRAMYVDPRAATPRMLQRFNRRLSQAVVKPHNITDPEVARAYLFRRSYQDNLGVRAARAQRPLTSHNLYDLFKPIIPMPSWQIVHDIQRDLDIEQVIAVPFFLMSDDVFDDASHVSGDGRAVKELVGDLIAAKGAEISERDIMLLSAFARQAAIAIENERRRFQVEIAQDLVFQVQTSLHSEQEILDWITQGVVNNLGYVGAMVALYDLDNSLPAQAWYVDTKVASDSQIRQWEKMLSAYTTEPLSLTDSEMTRVYLHLGEYSDNLSVRAARAEKPLTSGDLFDLLKPIVPPSARAAVREIQTALGIQRIIAVPFFFDALVNGKPKRQLAGNLFAATRSRSFRSSEISLLRTFGQQAAVGIRNARLYRNAEERRKAAQVFGKMAFSAATAVHSLANHIGVFQTHLAVLKALSSEERDMELENSSAIQERLDKVMDILNTLREPWHQPIDCLTHVNICLQRALDETIAALGDQELSIVLSLSDNLPPIQASSDMLTEAFKVLIKNAIEAIREKGTDGRLEIGSNLGAEGEIEVQILDNGIGIAPENLNSIFDIGWSTKQNGMGFGLFWTRDYVEGLGGQIQVQSVAYEGTKFRIVLLCPVLVSL